MGRLEKSSRPFELLGSPDLHAPDPLCYGSGKPLPPEAPVCSTEDPRSIPAIKAHSSSVPRGHSRDLRHDPAHVLSREIGLRDDLEPHHLRWHQFTPITLSRVY